jgi:hypothetical protein
MKSIGAVLATVALGATWALGVPPITDRGWGAVHVGMSVRELRAEGFHLAEQFTDADDCAYLQSSKTPDLRVMVEGGRVVRVETEQASISTDRGVRVGHTLAQVRREYPDRIVERRHQYADDGSYLIIYTTDRRRALLLEVINGKVVGIRGGVLPAVEYVEGCS